MNPTAPDQRNAVTASAPGKIILSGEHAVVYGRPALVTAVERRARAVIRRHTSPAYRFELPDVGLDLERTAAEVLADHAAAAERLDAFLAGRQEIDRVLAGPADLLALCVALSSRPEQRPEGGLHLRVTSSIPLGRGMGSSAAVIVALLQAQAAWNGAPYEPGPLAEAAFAIERFVHGRPSGADPHACARGGCFRFVRGRPPVPLALPVMNLYLVDTGAPVSRTGACVEAVRRGFEHDAALWDAFEETTRAFEAALTGFNQESVVAAVRRNHALLARIGVVPHWVAAFIERLERAGLAGKICGAGAVAGEHGGMVLVAGGPPPAALVDEFDYITFPMEVAAHGVRIED